MESNKFSFAGKTHTEETKKRIGEANQEAQSGQRNSQYGTIWITNGVNNRKIKHGAPIPDGWYKGRRIKYHSQWVTDGCQTRKIEAFEKIPDGWKIRTEEDKPCAPDKKRLSIETFEKAYENADPKGVSSKLKGDINELQVILYAIQHGVNVSIPFGDRCRYDQIWDYNGRIFRVQAKTPQISKDSISVTCKSVARIHGKYIQHPYTSDEIDCIATYFDGECYVIPVDEIGSTAFALRLNFPKNNQATSVHLAENYTFDKFLERISKKMLG